MRGYYIPIQKDLSPDLVRLIENLLYPDPTKRPSASKNFLFFLDFINFNTKAQLLGMDFVIRNFNRLVEKNLLNQGVVLPKIKNAYVNNPFMKKSKTAENENIKNKKKKFKTPSKIVEKNLKTEEKNEQKEKTDANIYEKHDLNLTIKENAILKKPMSLNHPVLKNMKDALEKIKKRKEKENVQKISLKPFPFEFEKNIVNSPLVKRKPTKTPKKNNSQINEKSFVNEKIKQNESHFIDLNENTKFPEIEKSKISIHKPNDSSSFITDRRTDRKFNMKNVSYNQWMMNKFRQEKMEIENNRIISLKEIHQKYILNQPESNFLKF